MPETDVVIYAEPDGTCPLLLWMDRIPPKAQDKCLIRIERLKQLGHEIRRPESDYLRDEVYELRATMNRVHYRILYFFHATQAVLSHGLTKEGSVPAKEIDLAIKRKTIFVENPLTHTHKE